MGTDEKVQVEKSWEEIVSFLEISSIKMEDKIRILNTASEALDVFISGYLKFFKGDVQVIDTFSKLSKLNKKINEKEQAKDTETDEKQIEGFHGNIKQFTREKERIDKIIKNQTRCRQFFDRLSLSEKIDVRISFFGYCDEVINKDNHHGKPEDHFKRTIFFHRQAWVAYFIACLSAEGTDKQMEITIQKIEKPGEPYLI